MNKESEGVRKGGGWISCMRYILPGQWAMVCVFPPVGGGT